MASSTTTAGQPLQPGTTVIDPESPNSRALVLRRERKTADEFTVGRRTLQKYHSDRDIPAGDPVVSVAYVNALNKFVPVWGSRSLRELQDIIEATDQTDTWAYPVSCLERASAVRTAAFSPNQYLLDSGQPDLTIALTPISSGIQSNQIETVAGGYGYWISKSRRNNPTDQCLARYIDIHQDEYREATVGTVTDELHALKSGIEDLAMRVPTLGEDLEHVHIVVPEDYHADTLRSQSPDGESPLNLFPDHYTVEISHNPDDPRHTGLTHLLRHIRASYSAVKSRRTKGAQEHMGYDTLDTSGLLVIKDKYEFSPYQLACRCPFYQKRGFCKHQLNYLQNQVTHGDSFRVALNDNTLWEM